ncbi:PREDICTED: CCR4-NOT transcription complex subunit 3-like [Camelina sativa]|uniref:CCR4-NOT transcription complex subunit 3-like n=1 Tax=Camelina sativa TaxID=90675 RepID=A0ABM0Y6G7_CAMSA|nr:PREDICTED: CCR4-NOT transcription complex subunit 3-like [Camelina sativa]
MMCLFYTELSVYNSARGRKLVNFCKKKKKKKKENPCSSRVRELIREKRFPMSSRSSQFMDKQIMDLSSSPPSTDFNFLVNDHIHNKKEEIVPSYDFQPIRSTSAAPLSHSPSDLLGSTTTSSSTEPRVNWSSKGFGSLDSIEPSKLVPDDKAHYVSNTTTILSEIDTTVKKHVDTLLHVMESVCSRLTQLETRTLNLQNLVDDLKVSVDNTTDAKFTQLTTILLEVQSDVQLLKDKQDILQAQPQLSKHHVSKVDQHTKTHSLHGYDPNAHSPAPVPPLTSFPQPPSSAASPSQPPSSQLLAQLPTQFSPQQAPSCPPPNQFSPYQAPQTPMPHQPPYQSPAQQQPPPSLGYKLDEQPPYHMQSYPPNPPLQLPPAGSAPSQQFYNPPKPRPSMYDGADGRSNSGFPSGYSSEPYAYTGSPVASAKPPHISSSGTGYPQLPNSRPLPHALPMASAVSSGGGSSSPRSESRVPIDDVIDRVTTMGFPRDQVRATVRKLTENGQAVDLNVVLDKLMNEGAAPPGGWSGGR